MKTRHHIPILTLGLSFIINASSAYAIPVTEAPTGSIVIDGDSFNYGTRPEIKIVLNQPQKATEVLSIGGGALNPDETTIHIKQDSKLKVKVLTINLGNKAKGKEFRASALVNAPKDNKNILTNSYYGNRYIFFHGSEETFKKEYDDYYGPPGADNDLSNLFPRGIYSLNTNVDSFVRLPKTANEEENLKLKKADGITEIEVPVKAGDTVDFNIQLWSRSTGFLNMDTRLKSIENSAHLGGLQAPWIEKDKRQRQITSLFNNMPIPLNDGVGSQADILDLLSDYAKPRTNEKGQFLDSNGQVVANRADAQVLADLDSTQMINLVDQNFKYNRRFGTPSSIYDMQDFVFLVEVGGTQQFSVSDVFDYLLVKIDIPAPVVILNPETGEPYVDGEGNYIDGPLPQKEGDPVPNIIHVDGSDTIAFDEVIPIDPNNFDPNETYQFTTPNGIYGSIYKLVYVAKEDVNIIVNTEAEIELIKKGKEVKIDELLKDTLRIPYSFEFVGLKDPTSPYATDPANIGPYRMMSDSQYGIKRSVAGFSAVTDNLGKPRGSFAKLYIHRKFTYNDDAKIANTLKLTYKTAPENKYTDVANILGMSEQGDATIVKQIPITNSGRSFAINTTGEHLPSETANVLRTGISSVIPSGSNGEEHFSCYNYLAKWQIVNGLPVIAGYDLYLPNKNRSTIRVYSPPSGTLTFDNTTAVVPIRRTYPNYSAVIKNTYPKAKTYVRNRSVETGTILQTSQAYRTKAYFKPKDEFSSTDEPDLGKIFPDGEMVMELVHEIDYDNDGTVDDLRILDSKPWILKRDIIIRGKVNSK